MRSNFAFSLIELSIVLVILGLLTGGILAGQSLIHAAELRSVATQHDRYVAAIHAFRDKYFALPGDMTNATSFWGAAAVPASCATTQGTGTQTCDGDGDGKVGLAAPLSAKPECYRFWQHLANAGLIEGQYSGIVGTQTDNRNAPSGKVAQAVWYTQYLGTVNGTGSVTFFDGPYDHVLFYGIGSGNTGWPTLQVFSAEDMWNIDTKLDDGKPALGKVVVAAGDDYELADFTTAVDGDSNPATANYRLDTKDKEIVAVFRQQY
jgi:prepilin-type N-terminal cleavage/methylation domain-containing protein